MLFLLKSGNKLEDAELLFKVIPRFLAKKIPLS
jgi:hypothetical protein